ncbi:MAG TPA: DUF222 domain-containing protein, partial [Pseudonocardiaceae bacterium]|nr:DUF222 domain-containing protein [Pseudonocardiaceae bacterium]
MREDDCEGEEWHDPAWLTQIPEPEDLGQLPAAECAPSGWLALELDHATTDPARLSDADLIDTIVGFDRITSWASARQARLLAEFARRRPDDYSQPTCSDAPSQRSNYASDEVALALGLSRTAAIGRLTTARTLMADLPGTLAGWEAGTLDARKVRAITDAAALLAPHQRGALEARVLPRARTQILPRLRAALARAVLTIDPDGAARRYQQRRKDRRVVVTPDDDGMASLWALLSAPDATAAYQRLGELARKLGAGDPRGMDARRADLLADLLTGRRCAAAGNCPDGDCACPGNDDRDIDDQDTAPVAAAAADAAHSPGRGGDDLPVGDKTDQGGHRCKVTRGRGPGKPLVSVIVPITMLMGLDEQPGELVGYGPIPAPLAREIAAQGIWRRLLTDPASGALLEYGRTTYTPPAGLADFVRARDLYCRNPICGQRAATADLDHALAWNDGGTTDACNLYAACRHDHLIKTFAPGWHVDQRPDGTVTWTTSSGHTYISHPH